MKPRFLDINLKNLSPGLDAIHQLTKEGDKTLRIEMKDSEGNERYAQYEFVFNYYTLKYYLLVIVFIKTIFMFLRLVEY